MTSESAPTVKKTKESEQNWNDPVEVSDNWCIYRIPSKLRNVDEAAYTPQLISIGPFHHGNPKLRDMESHKRKYYKNFCKHYSLKKADLKGFIRKRKESILHCYAGAIDHEIDFVKVILVDACFIFELFLRNYRKTIDKNYYILKSPWLRKAVEQDLLLFENQLPYFLLQELFVFAMSPSSSSGEQQTHLNDLCIGNVKEELAHYFLQLACMFFKEYNKEGKCIQNEGEVKHFTDLVRHFLCPIENLTSKGSGGSIPTKNMYNVRKLKEAGVKFRPDKDTECFIIKRDESHKCNFNLPCFRTMHLKLSKFWASYEVECVIRNVMALEQLVYTEKAYVCSYFLLLHQLVDSVEDVNLLIENGVIGNLLGNSEAVTKLINSLCEQIMDGKSCYADICEQLNKHYEISLWNRNIAILRGVYFKNFWTCSLTILGLFVLVFSIIGAIKLV